MHKVRPLRQDPRWPRAHERLKELFQERVPDGMTQEEFGERYGIGSQGMVWQYLNGWTPLNIEAAEKFAAGLNCTIADISQEMASYIKERIVVRLGKISRRVAVWAGAVLSLYILPSHDAQSALHKQDSSAIVPQIADLNTHCVRFMLTIARIAQGLFAYAKQALGAWEFRAAG